jgi:hypothetical protein
VSAAWRFNDLQFIRMEFVMSLAILQTPSRRAALDSFGVVLVFALALGGLLQISDLSVTAAPQACGAPAAQAEVARAVAVRDRLAAGSPYLSAKIGQPEVAPAVAAAQADIDRARAALAGACLG